LPILLKEKNYRRSIRRSVSLIIIDGFVFSVEFFFIDPIMEKEDRELVIDLILTIFIRKLSFQV